MTISVEFWQLVTLLLSFFGFVAGVAKVIGRQNVKYLDTRFATMEESRQLADAAIHTTLKQHIEDEAKNSDQLIALERQMLRWQADMPLNYVRREDFIRNQTNIEAKLDGLALKIENALLKGGYPK